MCPIANDCVQGGRGSNFGDFCEYELCDDAYNSFEKQNIWKAKEMKEQNKKNKMLLKINKEFLRAQKCQL